MGSMDCMNRKPTRLDNAVGLLLGLIPVVGFVAMVGCTDNQRTKAFGGSMSVQIPCDQQVFDVTWKGEDLWYATQPAPSGWTPQAKRFTEYSSYGMIQGEVALTDSRCGS